MRRILFDKNVPYPLRHHLPEAHVRTAEEEGWGQITNGDLLRLAERAGYHILITCDQSVLYQQNRQGREIALLVLGSNIWPAIIPRLQEILNAVQAASPNSFAFIEIAPLPKRRKLGEAHPRQEKF